MIKGRIIKGVGGLYSVDTENQIWTGRARGIFRKNNIKPIIGDFVEISVLDEKTMECSIEKILERKNKLVRPSVSNVDQVFIVFSIKNPDPNFDLLDRFLVIAEQIDLEIVICINKMDLNENNLKLKILETYKYAKYKIIFLSAYSKDGINEIVKCCNNKVSAFAGPSGVGKSSIINLLTESDVIEMETGTLSEKIQRGKHTTRHVELLKIANGFIMDTPGFTSIAFENIEKNGLQYLFPEFLPYEGLCKYRDCMHIKEVGCKIKEEVEKTISKERYNRYVQFFNEL